MEATNQGETGKEVAKLSQAIQIDEGKIQEHLGEVVRSTVEETLNALRTRKPTAFAEPSGMNGPGRGRTRGRVPTSGTCRRKRGKSR